MERAMKNDLSFTDEQLLERAFRAYFRRGWRDQPANYSGVSAHRGQRYVLLRNVRGTLAVFAADPARRLRWLEEWPHALDVW
jgi:hypothetical protein